MKKVMYLFVICIGLIACDQKELDNIPIKGDNQFIRNARINFEKEVELKNGFLHFKSIEVFEKYSKISDNMTEILSASYPQFKSKNARYIDFLNSVSKSKNQKELLQLIKENKGIVELENDECKIADQTPYDDFIPNSETPIFYVGNMIYYFDKNNEYIIYDGDIEKIKKIKNGELLSSDVIKITHKRSNRGARNINSECLSLNGEYTNGNYKGKSSSNIYVIGSAYNTLGGVKYFKMHWRVITEGSMKKRILGIWFASAVDKTLVINHKWKGYLDANLLFSNFVDATYSNSNTGSITHTMDEFFEPNVVILSENQLNRATGYVEDGFSGRLISQSLSGEDVYYICQ